VIAKGPRVPGNGSLRQADSSPETTRVADPALVRVAGAPSGALALTDQPGGATDDRAVELRRIFADSGAAPVALTTSGARAAWLARPARKTAAAPALLILLALRGGGALASLATVAFHDLLGHGRWTQELVATVAGRGARQARLSQADRPEAAVCIVA